MIFFDDLIIWPILTVIFSIFTLLIFGYKKYFIGSISQYCFKPLRQDLQVFYLICIISLLFGLSIFSAYQSYYLYKKNTALIVLEKPFTVTKTGKTTKTPSIQKPENKSKLIKNQGSSISPPTPSTAAGEPKDFFDEINLVMTILGVFVALITGITLTIARNSVDDLRIANENQVKIHKERLAELDNKYKRKEVIFLIIQSKITVIAKISSAENEDKLDSDEISSVPILNAKLNLLNEASSLGENVFSLQSFKKLLNILEMIMKNPAYREKLGNYFSEDDLETFEALLSFLEDHPTDIVKYKMAAEALRPFIDKLKIILKKKYPLRR